MFRLNGYAPSASSAVAHGHGELLRAARLVLCVSVFTMLGPLLPLKQVAAQDSAESENELSPQQQQQWQQWK